MKKSRSIGFVVAAVLAWPVMVAVQSGRGGPSTASVQWATVGGMSGNARYSTLTRSRRRMSRRRCGVEVRALRGAGVLARHAGRCRRRHLRHRAASRLRDRRQERRHALALSARGGRARGAWPGRRGAGGGSAGARGGRRSGGDGLCGHVDGERDGARSENGRDRLGEVPRRQPSRQGPGHFRRSLSTPPASCRTGSVPTTDGAAR